MSWNSSQLVQTVSPVQAVKPSRKYFKAEQEISTDQVSQSQVWSSQSSTEAVTTAPISQLHPSKPTGYFNQAMVRLSPQSGEPLPQAVKYSYVSFALPSPTQSLTVAIPPQPLVRQNYQSKYRQIVAYLESVWVSKSKKDLQTIETTLEQLTHLVHSSQPSRTAVRDTFAQLSQRLSEHNRQTPDSADGSPIAALTQIRSLLDTIAQKQITEPSETDLNEFSARSIFNLQAEKLALQQQLVQLTQSHQGLAQEILSSRSKLNAIVQKSAEDVRIAVGLQESIQTQDQTIQNTYAELQTQSTQIELLNLQINHLNQQIIDFKTQQQTLSSTLLDRDHQVAKRDRTINTLNTQLSKYDRIRVLEGNYIAIPSSKGSKYHFHKKCPGWKMLVGEYMLNLDPSRAVVSSKDATFFIKCGLSECLDCKSKTH